jgi:transcriptional regulator with XRE-family HTH domain
MRLTDYTPPELLRIIRKARKHHGFTQKDMAERLDMTSLAYQRLERGVTKLDVERLISIVKILRIEL